MSPQPWERIISEHLGEAAWDAGTELVAMMADEVYPTLLDDGYRHRQAAHAVVNLCSDTDWRRCIEALLAVVPAAPSMDDASGVES